MRGKKLGNTDHWGYLASEGTQVPPSSHTGCSYHCPTGHVRGQKPAPSVFPAQCPLFAVEAFLPLRVLLFIGISREPHRVRLSTKRDWRAQHNNWRSRRGGEGEQGRDTLQKRLVQVVAWGKGTAAQVPHLHSPRTYRGTQTNRQRPGKEVSPSVKSEENWLAKVNHVLQS